MELIDKVFQNNQKWIEETEASEKDFFKHLAEGQSPDILYIGCSDSRVTAEDMTGCKPGEMFVHRNVANLVPINDFSSAAVIEYAIEHLHVKHVVVCGHYFCGGVKAAMQQQNLGILNPWLANIRDVYRIHKKELDAINDESARYKRLVELNVEEQCINVMKMDVWQRHYSKSKSPDVHGWVFDIQTGKLIDLKIDFEDDMKDVGYIYNLGVENERTK